MSTYVYVFKLTSNSILHAEARSFSCLEQAGSLQLNAMHRVLLTKHAVSDQGGADLAFGCSCGLLTDACPGRLRVFGGIVHSAQHVQPCIGYSTWPEVGPKSDSNVLANGDMISDIRYTLK